MAEQTPIGSGMQGILVPSPLIVDADSVWSAQTNATEAGIFPGSTVADQTDALRWSATGTPAAGDAVGLRISRGGYPGLDGPEFVWRATPAGGSASDYYGWNFPAWLVRHEAIGTWDAAAINDRIRPFPLSLPDGRILVVAEYRNTAASPTVRAVAFNIRSAAGVWGSWVVLRQEEDVASIYALSPTLVLIPGRDGQPDRVQCYHFSYVDLTGNNDPDTVSVRMYEAPATADFDALADWTLSSENGWLNPLSTSTYASITEIRRLRVAYNGSQHLMIWDYSTSSADVVTQWASHDGGYTFSQVDTDVAAFDRLPDIAVSAGLFIVCGLHISGSDYIVKAYRVPDAFETIDNSTAITVDTYTAVDSLAICADEAGILYVHTGETSDSNNCQVFRSVDYGASYEGLGTPSSNEGQAWWDGGVNAHPTEVASTWHRGRVVITCNHAGGTSPDYRDGASALYLGGYSSLPLPMRETWPSPVRQFYFANTWTGFANLGELLTTTSINGTQTMTVDGRQQDVTGTGGQYDSYYKGITASLAEVIVYASVEVTAGAASLSLRVTDNSSKEYHVYLLFQASTLNFYDNPSGASMLGSAASVSGEVEVVMALDGVAGKASAWYRSAVTADPDVRTWTKLTTTSDPTAKTSSPASNNRVQYRAGSPVAASTAKIRHLSFTSSSSTDRVGDGLASGWATPGSLLGRGLASVPVYIHDGISQGAGGGRASTAYTYTRTPDHTYAIEHALPTVQPSPRVPWRSTSTTADMTIGLAANSGAYDHYVDNTILGLHLVGCRGFRECQLIGRTAAGADTTLATINLSETFSFTRTGRTLVPVALGDPILQRWLGKDELAGCYFEDSGGKVRLIEGNSEGILSAGGGTATGHRVRVYLDDGDFDNSEGTSGTGRIWYRDVLTVVHLGAMSTKYAGYKLKIRTSSTPTAELGFFEIGSIVLGPIIPLSEDWSRRVTRVTEPRVDIETAPDGTKRMIKRGPAAHRVEVAITETHVDMSNVLQSGVVSGIYPDYITSGDHTGAEPVATWDAAPLMLEHLIDSLDGPKTPVSLLWGLDRPSSGTPPVAYTYRGGRNAMYSHVTSAYRREQVFGEHVKTQADRVPTLVFERID